ncbi:MAG TPA: class I SAM-dependent methyltransferase [Gaiellaceae bacterium]|nr:class I SAM-dependent methyltransferase [Gaiellaceae bacterium]
MRPRIERSVGRRFFGSDPEMYDAVRPGHPDGVYDIVRARCNLTPGSKVLEIGPGTGQATRRLLELGADLLVAIEPDPALAEYLLDALGSRVDVRVTTLEDAELEPAEYDLAVAASSFHWVEEALALAKLRPAMRSGGSIAIWWTSFGDEMRPDAFSLALDPLFEDIPHGPSGPTEGRPSFARDVERRLAAMDAAGFEDAEHAELRWRNAWDTAGIRGLYSTFSPLSALEPARREAFLDEVAQIADTEFGGRVEKPLVTSVYTARKPA